MGKFTLKIVMDFMTEIIRNFWKNNEEVIESEEWTMPEEEIQNGLTIVVIGGLIRK